MGQGLFGDKKKVSSPRRILVTGLVSAGQSTLLKYLESLELKRTKGTKVLRKEPSQGFYTEELLLPRHGIQLLAFDVGGSMKIRPLLRHYYAKTTGIVFVLDCSDNKDSYDLERVALAKKELHQILSESELNEEEVPMLVLANKQDKKNAMSASKVIERLRLNDVRIRRWYIQECSAVTGDGVLEGLEWIFQNAKLR